MKLTKAHILAGIIEVISTKPNGNGSVTCEVTLKQIDRDANGTNFRKEKKAHVRQISGEGFKQHAVRNPILLWNRVTKMLQTIDGRHTISALIDEEYKKWTCDIHFDMTESEAASVFYELTQNNKRMAPWDALAAALSSGYKFAVEIHESLDMFGFTTPNHSGYNKDTADLPGPTPVIEAQYFGQKFLTKFLSVLKTWKDNCQLEELARKNVFQRGLIDFLRVDGRNVPIVDIKRALMRRTSYEITQMAQEVAGCRRSDRNHFKAAFESVFNLVSRPVLRRAA